MRIPIEAIIPDPNQPRKTFDKEAIKELASSFDNYGIISPLKVRPHGDNRYMIIVGEMRYRASKQRGDKKIECVVQEATDQQAREMQLIENLQRNQILPLELGKAFKAHCKAYNLTIEGLAKRIGLDARRISDFIALTKLSPDIRGSLDKLSFVEARQIATIPDHKRQEEVAQPFIRGEVSSMHAQEICEIARKEPKRPIKEIIREVITGKSQEREVAQLEAAKRAAGITLETPEELMRGAEALRKEAQRKAREAMTPEKKAALEAEKKAEAERKTEEKRVKDEAKAAAKAKREEEKRLKDEEKKRQKDEENQKREERAEKKARKQLLENHSFLGEVIKAAPKELIEERLYTEEEREILSKPSKPTTAMDKFYELEKLANKLADGLVELQEFPAFGKAVLGMALQNLRRRIDETLQQMGIKVTEGEAKLIEGE